MCPPLAKIGSTTEGILQEHVIVWLAHRNSNTQNDDQQPIRLACHNDAACAVCIMLASDDEESTVGSVIVDNKMLDLDVFEDLFVDDDNCWLSERPAFRAANLA